MGLKQIVKFEFTAGRLLCGTIRDYLKREQFAGRKIQFYEGTGWIERTFLVKGDAKDIVRIEKQIKNWFKENDCLD